MALALLVCLELALKLLLVLAAAGTIVTLLDRSTR